MPFRQHADPSGAGVSLSQATGTWVGTINQLHSGRQRRASACPRRPGRVWPMPSTLRMSALDASVEVRFARHTPVTGESLLFVAPGGTGKTTLARVLGRRYGYLIDETVGIDGAGRIHAYPKPLLLRVPGGGHKEEASPDDLGLARAHLDPRVRRVILLDRTSGHAGAAPEVVELGTLDAVERMLPETSSLRRLPRPLRTLADLAEQRGPVLRCSYAGGRRPGRAGGGTHRGSSLSAYVCVEVIDRLVIDGESIELFEERYVRLAGWGPTS